MSKCWAKRDAGHTGVSKGCFMSCYLPADVIAFVEQYARENERPNSWVVRQLVKRGLPHVRALPGVDVSASRASTP